MITSPIEQIIGETGIVSQLDHNSQTILFDRQYDNPVIFTQPLSYNGTQPAIVRIEEIQSDRFTAFIQEPRNLDGKHMKESFSYIVLEQGTWELEDDTVLEVGTVNTDLLAPNGWENIEFTNDFADNPLTFSQVQTDNDKDFVRTRQRNTRTNGFQITMEEEEAFNYSGHGEETVGWLAISAGNGNWSQNNYLAGTTGDKVNHNLHTIDLGNNFSQPPVVLSSIASYDGGDPSGLRYSKLSSNQIDLKIEEDTTSDRETSHTTEVVNFFAIDGNNPLMGSQAGSAKEAFDLTSCEKENVKLDNYNSPVWLGDTFEGSFCRGIIGDAEKFQVDIESTRGGFDTAIVRKNSALRVDSLNSQTKVFSTIDVALNGSGNWWVGPKFPIKEDVSQGLSGNYENYIVENASRTPSEYHQRLTNQGNYLGQTYQDGSWYNHYYTKHNTWGQFWAIRQNYRETGSVTLKPILNIWRNNGLPNKYISPLRVNVETSGKVTGTVEMSDLDIPTW